MKRLFAIAAHLTLTALILLVGCGSPQSAIVGKWKGGNTGVMQFSKDGTFLGGDNFSGTYTFPDDTHLRISSGNDSMTGTFRVKGDTLTLTLENMDGRPVTRELHRVKE